MKIKCFQALAWWVTDLTLQGKIIDLDYFKTDILADAIEESTLDFEDTRDGKRELSKPRSVLEFLLQAYELLYFCYSQYYTHVHATKQGQSRAFHMESNFTTSVTNPITN